MTFDSNANPAAWYAALSAGEGIVIGEEEMSRMTINEQGISLNLELAKFSVNTPSTNSILRPFATRGHVRPASILLSEDTDACQSPLSPADFPSSLTLLHSHPAVYFIHFVGFCVL